MPLSLAAPDCPLLDRLQTTHRAICPVGVSHFTSKMKTGRESCIRRKVRYFCQHYSSRWLAAAGLRRHQHQHQLLSPAAVNLGTVSTFAVMATSAISGTGAILINGDVGLAPGTSQGIPPSQVNGTIHVNDASVTQAQVDLLAAYNDAVARSANAQTLQGNLGGLTFSPASTSTPVPS